MATFRRKFLCQLLVPHAILHSAEGSLQGSREMARPVRTRLVQIGSQGLLHEVPVARFAHHSLSGLYGKWWGSLALVKRGWGNLRLTLM